ncbi:hypothetical protein X798_04435, partial [Onchocerca flexuosa]
TFYHKIFTQKLDAIALLSDFITFIVCDSEIVPTEMAEDFQNTIDFQAVICKTALDCPQEEPHVCQNGICKAYSAIKHRKPAKMTSVCSTFLDCSPGLICSKGRCIKE